MRTEGFQRAIGKPFGRARRRETFCICKNAYKTCKKNEAKYFVNALKWFYHFFDTLRGDRGSPCFHSYPVARGFALLCVGENNALLGC